SQYTYKIEYKRRSNVKSITCRDFGEITQSIYSKKRATLPKGNIALKLTQLTKILRVLIS
ncbi:hypothetical protein LCGC14_1412330, partial [marine sediment metagenome]